MKLHEFLVAPLAHLPPDKTLDGLDTADAERGIAGAPHSVAHVVAHMAFWQDWFYARCTGEAVPVVTSAASGWPAVPANSWPDVRARFIGRLQQLASLSKGDVARRVTPAIEFPPMAHYTIADALVHVATHNAHHLGQVIVLRQMIGRWPPPGGGWTW
jgi:uncharacterized damage-inducible protein DinB